MSETFQNSDSSSQSERRIHCRQRVLFSCAELGENNGGTILNISESGMALQTIAELAGNKLLNLRFQFSRSRPWLEVKGQITWLSDSKRMAGVEFIDLPDEARKQIRSWISLTSDAARFGKEALPLDNITENAATTIGTAPISAGPLPSVRAVPASQANHRRDLVPRLMRPGVAEGAGVLGKAFRLVGLSLAAVVLLAALIFLGRYLLKTGGSHKAGRAESESEVPGYSSVTPPIEPIDLRIPADTPAFVLQVGAMLHEKNAQGLLESLLQGNYPAFVLKRANDRFYRVMVGPYYGMSLTLKAKRDLANQGFQAIHTQWKTNSVGPVDVAARERIP